MFLWSGIFSMSPVSQTEVVLVWSWPQSGSTQIIFGNQDGSFTEVLNLFYLNLPPLRLAKSMAARAKHDRLTMPHRGQMIKCLDSLNKHWTSAWNQHFISAPVNRWSLIISFSTVMMMMASDYTHIHVKMIIHMKKSSQLAIKHRIKGTEGLRELLH